MCIILYLFAPLSCVSLHLTVVASQYYTVLLFSTRLLRYLYLYSMLLHDFIILVPCQMFPIIGTSPL
jgi:hypothetical protein